MHYFVFFFYFCLLVMNTNKFKNKILGEKIKFCFVCCSSAFKLSL
jgi:hypothetical protein